MFVFCGRPANFRKTKKKTGDDLYKSLIIFLYSWLHTRGKKKDFGKFLLFFSLVTIENFWKHLNLEFLTFNFIFWWNFVSKNKDHPHYALTKRLKPIDLFMSSNHMQHWSSFFSCSVVSLGYLILHFPSDLVSWDCCYKKFPRQTQKLNCRKLVAQWWESVEKRMLKTNVAHGVLVSSRKSKCREKHARKECHLRKS